MTRKVIVRLKGGLGNQLFSYAAARRLALVNDAELAIDDVTGFVRDHTFRRKYALDRFQIPVRKATAQERLEPFERYRRGLMKRYARYKPIDKRNYIEQQGNDFDPSILALHVRGTLYLDGFWQSENYFKDVEGIIRQDLCILPPDDSDNQEMSQRIGSCTAVCVHVRWFEKTMLSDTKGSYNLTRDYYAKAAKAMTDLVGDAHFFIFSDDPIVARTMFAFPEGRGTVVGHNQGNAMAYADLWLMTQCKHFIIANSTFSWWGAWLAESRAKIVMAPDVKLSGLTAWGFRGLIPKDWLVI